MRGRKQVMPVRALCALIGICTLLGQSVLPAAAATGEHSIATTADTGSEAASTAGYTVSEEDRAQSLSYFKQIRVNSLNGNLIIRSGENYAIRFIGDWRTKPQYQVQEKVLTINGNVSGGVGTGNNSTPESASVPESSKTVVLGEDTQTGAADEAETAAAESDAMILDGSAGHSTAAGSSWTAEAADEAAGDESESEVDEAADDESDNRDDDAAVQVVGDSENGGTSDTAAAADEDTSENDGDTSSPGAESENDSLERQLLSDGPVAVVTIPSGISMEKLWISLDDGGLLITDISSDQVSIWTGDGDLRTRGTNFGTVEIYAGNGDIVLGEAVFNSLYISSGEGNISVQSSEGLERCLMQLKTGDGTITVNGARKGSQYLQTGNGKRSLDVQAESGDISVRGE